MPTPWGRRGGNDMPAADTRGPEQERPVGEIVRVNCTGPAVLARAAKQPGSWATRYRERHRMRRVHEWPRGIDPPKKVRVYLRSGHFLLQWWDPSAGKNLSQRVDGDVVDAVVRAREIERRLVEFKSSGRGAGVRLSPDELVAKFLTDLNARADAGEVQP